jgi:A/G-specific adenine glycosylase
VTARSRILSLSKDDVAGVRRSLLAWHRRHGQRAPWRGSGDAYQALVAAVMAQQTQMSRVLPKFDEFTAAYPTVETLAAAPTGDVLRRWAPLGYNMRALRLQRAAQTIVGGGGFPRTAAELREVNGIGPFTAAIVASFAFGEPAPAIDTNVRRVIARLLGIEAPGDRELTARADALISRRAPGRWNQAVMDLGASVCTARARCDVCPLARWCRARADLTARSLPLEKKEMIGQGAQRRVAEARAGYGVDRLKPVPRKGVDRLKPLPRKGVDRLKPVPRTRKEPFHGSRRYYRGRIVQALRELPPGASITPAALYAALPHRDGLSEAGLREVIASLQRDGLVRVLRGGRVRLP